MAFTILRSPLAGTAGVLTALGLLAIPLHHLTSSRHAPAARLVVTPPPAAAPVPALLRLKLLTPARSIRISTEAGTRLLDLTNVAAGETELDATLPIHDDSLDLLLEADLGDNPADTAVFLTVMPDAREGQTRYTIGSGTLSQPLRFNWRQR